MNKQQSIDTNTLDLLPVAVILFDNKQIYYLNQKAISLFKLSKVYIKNNPKISIYDFIDVTFHKNLKQRANSILNGVELDCIEQAFFTSKKETIFLEVKSNTVSYNNKKVVQGIFTDISERVAFKNELTESKNTLELIAKNANDIIFFYTYYPKPKYLYVSSSIKKILGYTDEDFYNNSSLCTSLVIDKKGYTLFEKELKQQQQNNTLKYVSKTFQYKTKAGKLIWLEDNYSPIYDNEGNVKSILGISRDITHEKNYQLELEQKWISYKNLLDISPIGIFIHKNYCIYSNKRAAEILEEKNPQNLMGKKLANFIIPEQRQIAIKRMQKSIAGEVLSDLVYTIKTVKGNLIDVELKTIPFIFNGKACVQTTIVNVSAEKKLAAQQIRAEIAEESNKKLTEEIEYRQKIEHELVTQTTKYEAIFNNTWHLIWTIDRNLKITSFNKNYQNYIKTIFNHDLKIGQYIGDVGKNRKSEIKLQFWFDKYNNFFNNKNDNKSDFFEIKNVSSNGKIYYREIFLHPIRSANGIISEIAIIGYDSTERRFAEQKIVEQSAKLAAIFESGEQLIWTVNKQFELTSYNKNYYNLIRKDSTRKKLDENKIISVFDTIYNKERKNFWLEKYKLVLSGKPSVFIHKTEINSKDVYREIYLYPIFLNNEVVEVSVIAQNITERIESQNKIIEQSAKLKAVFESGDQLMWTINNDYKITSLNKNYANAIHDLYNFYPEVGNNIKEISKYKTSKPDSIWDEKYALAFSGKQVELTTERVKLNGQRVFRQYYLYPIKNSNNQVIEVSGLGFDITENKTNEEKITQSLKEKEILLKEVHHRVKNNMQVISSILNLQSSYVKDDYALNLLKECQNRIKSMAFIHESLYQTKNFESVNFSEYVSTLTKNLIHTYSISHKKVKLILTLDKLYLNLDASIPCGLIINEIVSNSLKYAFPNNRDGIIFVTLKVDNNKVNIEIGDNGIGIPQDIDVKNTQTLGLQLVDTLIEQINGKLTLNRNKGTIFSIDFNI